MKVLIFVLGGLLGLGHLKAQESGMPRAFILGQQEAAYDQLIQTHRQPLLEACNNDMKVAFDKWIGMMKDLEEFARQSAFDINGIKLLLHVFWNEDGSVAHIGYFLRPDSRNLDEKQLPQLTEFLGKFAEQYRFAVTSNRKFSHYVRASFPTFVERAGN